MTTPEIANDIVELANATPECAAAVEVADPHVQAGGHAMINGAFDPSRYRWKQVTGRPGSKYKIITITRSWDTTATPECWT